jgi:hypothetical protein
MSSPNEGWPQTIAQAKKALDDWAQEALDAEQGWAKKSRQSVAAAFCARKTRQDATQKRLLEMGPQGARALGGELATISARVWTAIESAENKRKQRLGSDAIAEAAARRCEARKTSVALTEEGIRLDARLAGDNALAVARALGAESSRREAWAKPKGLAALRAPAAAKRAWRAIARFERKEKQPFWEALETSEAAERQREAVDAQMERARASEREANALLREKAKLEAAARSEEQMRQEWAASVAEGIESTPRAERPALLAQMGETLAQECADLLRAEREAEHAADKARANALRAAARQEALADCADAVSREGARRGADAPLGELAEAVGRFVRRGPAAERSAETEAEAFEDLDGDWAGLIASQRTLESKPRAVSAAELAGTPSKGERERNLLAVAGKAAAPAGGPRRRQIGA